MGRAVQRRLPLVRRAGGVQLGAGRLPRGDLDPQAQRHLLRELVGERRPRPRVLPRTLVEQDPAHKLYGTGHHNIVNIPGTDEWIIAYHRFAYNPAGRWSGGDGCHRETVFAPLNHNADGTLEPVRPQTGSYIRPLNF